ncbi:MAG: fructosamine kinase family protein [Gammaproteobacteria bacterium]|nr:fructosamine kinase family protein [Gammaproteobacteria bacterium]
MTLIPEIAEEISRATGSRFQPLRRSLVNGGCINRAEIIESRGERYFLKLNQPGCLEMFAAEAAGLRELGQASAIRVPAPVCWGVADGHSYLVLEYLALGRGDAGTAEELGRGLAQLHQVRGERFGWHRDNTIGTTPQINMPSEDWGDFWGRQRLGFQLQLAARNGYRGALQRDGERLLAALPALLDGHRPQPSLLHGDLWGGNYAADQNGKPVIFDPAVYFGDREADLAMTELFGGFPAAFYEAYRERLPLDSGYPIRKDLYNLYHILNHLNLFGGGYQAQAERMLASLLRTTGT